jgi:TolA-binding protein
MFAFDERHDECEHRTLNIQHRTSKLGLATLLAGLMLLGGCGGRADKEKLQAGYQSLESQQYDQAIAQADEYLKKKPDGTGSSEAMYLRGRAYEQKVAADPMEAKLNLQAARSAYVKALELKPSKKLEAYIRASLANVAYFQDDYTTALTQWATAHDDLEDPETKSWVLYRIALCQQRLGQFAEADKTFANVIQSYPNSVPAQRAAERQGARSFYVQVGTFSSPAGADKMMASLRSEGAIPERVSDAKGRQVVRVGPVQSYQQAQALKQRLAANHPDALIVP